METLKYSKQSQQKLSECAQPLQQVFMFALSIGLIDITVFEAIRSKAKQNRYYLIGKSKVQWPNGKHNVKGPNEKSRAVDAAPCISGKISWKKEHCIALAYIVLTCAVILNVKIRWGGNWDMDREPITDQDFQDLVHFELVEG